MKFTLEETIRNHREMWLWISRKIMEDAKRCATLAYKIAMLPVKEK